MPAKFLQEPLVLFTLIAALLFGISSLFSPADKNVLLIDSDEVEARLFLEELNSGEPLSESTRQAITAAPPESTLDIKKAYSYMVVA